MRSALLIFLLVSCVLTLSAQKSGKRGLVYYVTHTGDTVFLKMLKLKRGRLYYRDYNEKSKYLDLTHVSGYKVKGSEYDTLTPEKVASMHARMLKESSSFGYNSIPKYLLGLGLQANFLPNARSGSFAPSEPVYPFTGSSEDAYKNAYGIIRIWMPYFEASYHNDNLRLFSIGIGYTGFAQRGPWDYYNRTKVDLQDRYMSISYECPISQNWIKIKTKTGGIKYPFFGAGISLNSKSLSYDQRSQGTIGENSYHKTYHNNSILFILQSKLGFLKQYDKVYLKYGVNLNLLSHASGSYSKSQENIHFLFPSLYSWSASDSGSYSKTQLLGKYALQGLFFTIGFLIE